MGPDTRSYVHDLVDQVPAARLGAVRELLEKMIDLTKHSFADAPLDDEPVTPEDMAVLKISAILSPQGPVLHAGVRGFVAASTITPGE